MGWEFLIALTIFSISSMACFYLGVKAGKQEPLYESKVEEEIIPAPDYMGTDNGEE